MFYLYPRYFSKPSPSSNVVEECVDRLRTAIMSSLKHRWPEQKVTIEFRHDVFVFLFGGKGKPAEQRNWTLFEEQDFVKCKLPPNWSSIHDLHGNGVKLRFPIKMRAFLGRTPKNYHKEGHKIVEGPRAYIEKISINFIRIASSFS